MFIEVDEGTAYTEKFFISTWKKSFSVFNI